MSDRGSRPRSDERTDEQPPYSRIFVVCNKTSTEDDLREPFEALGKVENIYIPRDRNTGESKGVAYIKYAKTSSAAAAIKEYHSKVIGKKSSKPIRVMLACNRNDKDLNIDEEKYRRLFLIPPKGETEQQLRDHFSQFGSVTNIFFPASKNRNDKSGFAYITFSSFHETAVAFEECDKKYKAIFATPKDELKRNRHNYEGTMDNGFVKDFREPAYTGWSYPPHPQGPPDMMRSRENIVAAVAPERCCKIVATVDPAIPEKYVESLFNIIPGMQSFHYKHDPYSGNCNVHILYSEPKYAAAACERINFFEFPSGEIVSVKLDNDPIGKAAIDLKSIVDNFKNAIDSGRSSTDLVQLADAIAQASTLIKAAATSGAEPQDMGHDPDYCSVKLPLPKPLKERAPLAKRCFVVCKPYPPPPHVLKDIFRRFGDLIDVNMLPGKNFGFAKYASESSAHEAIRVLHGAIVCGNSLKVIEAEEQTDNKRLRMDVDGNDMI